MAMSYKGCFGELMGLLFVEDLGQGVDIECVKVYLTQTSDMGDTEINPQTIRKMHILL